MLGSGSVTVNSASGSLALSGFNFYSGATTVTSGTLTLNNGVVGSGGTISVGDTGVLQAGGTIQRAVVAVGPNQTGMIQAVGTLAISSATPINFGGLLDTQGNQVTLIGPSMSTTQTISSLNLGNGAILGSSTGIQLPTWNQLSANEGTPGLITMNGGTATISGLIRGGLVDGDFALAYDPTSSSTIVFTGIVRGTINAVGVNLDYSQGADFEGFSPTFIFSNSTKTFGPNTKFVVNGTTPYSVTPNTIIGGSVNGVNGLYTQQFVYSTLKNGAANSTGIGLLGGASFVWDPTSTLTSGFYATEKFYLVRTDGHMVASNVVSGATYTFTDGTLTGFSNIVANVTVTGMPALPSGLSWAVESTSAYIKLYVAGTVGQGSGVWMNGAGDQNWSTNTGANSNWSGGQPSSTGEIATFGSLAATPYAGGVVNVDHPQTIGGIVLSNSGQGGYTIGVNGGNALTLDNASNDGSGNLTHIDPTITVNSGTHTIAAPLVIASGGATNGLLVSVASSSQLTLSGAISSGYNTGINVTLNGPGTLNLNGVNSYQGSTLVNSGTLGGIGTIPGVTTVGGSGTIRGGVSDGSNNTGTLTIAAGASSLASGGTLQAELSRTGVNTASASLIKLSAGTFNLPSSFNINLLNAGTNDTPLVSGESYTITLMQVATSGSILLGGNSQGANAVIPSADYTLSSPTLNFSSHTLAIDSTGDLLQLSFTYGTPIPEPEHIMLLCVGVLLIFRVARRFTNRGRVATV